MIKRTVRSAFTATAVLLVRVKPKGVCIARPIYGNPSHNHGVSLAVWDHTVLPSTRHKRTHPAFTPARQAGTEVYDNVCVQRSGIRLTTERLRVQSTADNLQQISNLNFLIMYSGKLGFLPSAG